jgi:hydrogenase maturation protease
MPNHPTFLVIGYGNVIRGDDAVGQIVAERIEALQLENVRSIITHQLTPEIAADLAEADYAIFVDACIESDILKIEEIDPSINEIVTTGHGGNPASLLMLSKTLYLKHPKAWMIGIPAINFEFTEELSEIAKQGVDEAIEKIKELVVSR